MHGVSPNVPHEIIWSLNIAIFICSHLTTLKHSLKKRLQVCQAAKEENRHASVLSFSYVYIVSVRRIFCG